MPVMFGRSAVKLLAYRVDVVDGPNVVPSKLRARRVPSAQPEYSVPSTKNDPRDWPHVSDDGIVAGLVGVAVVPSTNCRRTTSAPIAGAGRHVVVDDLDPVDQRVLDLVHEGDVHRAVAGPGERHHVRDVLAVRLGQVDVRGHRAAVDLDREDALVRALRAGAPVAHVQPHGDVRAGGHREVPLHLLAAGRVPALAVEQRQRCAVGRGVRDRRVRRRRRRCTSRCSSRCCGTGSGRSGRPPSPGRRRPTGAPGRPR